MHKILMNNLGLMLHRMLFLLFCVICITTAQAQSAAYPERSVRVVIPFPAGGPPDILARALAEPFREKFRQTFVIDNRPGASGNIGAEIVAKATPDGYHLLVTPDTVITANPHMMKKAGFDPARDLTPLTLLTRISMMLLCHTSVPAKTVAELVALAGTQSLNYASGGTGAPNHLAMELFSFHTGAKMRHIPYKGAAPVLQDLLAGQVHCAFLGTPAVLPHIKSGRMNAIAISSTLRSPMAPHVPTVAESGFKDYDVTFYQVLAAPRLLAEPVKRALAVFANDALANPELQQRTLAPMDQARVGGSPTDAANRLREISVKWARIAKHIGLETNPPL